MPTAQTGVPGSGIQTVSDGKLSQYGLRCVPPTVPFVPTGAGDCLFHAVNSQHAKAARNAGFKTNIEDSPRGF